jgi:hypothetical protein
MIRPLRVRHRRIIAVLAVVTPLLFVAGLLARRPIPATIDLAIGTTVEDHPGHEVLSRDDDAWGGLPILTEWLRAPGDPAGDPAVSLELTGPLKQPDLLLYWDASPREGGLSDEARLLGPVGGRRRDAWDVPASDRPGRLVLYSLAHGEVVATAAPPDGWGATR